MSHTDENGINEEELFIAYMESGAYHDTTFDDYVESIMNQTEKEETQ